MFTFHLILGILGITYNTGQDIVEGAISQFFGGESGSESSIERAEFFGGRC